MTDQPSLLDTARRVRADLGDDYHDRLMESIFTDAARIADTSVTRTEGQTRLTFDRRLDRILTHPVWGFAAMGATFFVIFWITITGANIPSQLLSSFLLGTVYDALHSAAAVLSAPTWLSGLLIDGAYLATAWVVAVMLPPMAIFFPLFTLLEDFGFLPRVAFNLDALFARAGAHGKQSLSMMMGFGCNAAGIISTRIIDSPRERLIAILTNTFSICNGRWPTLILISTIFIASAVPAALASFIGAVSVVAVAGLGVVVTLLVSKGLSMTLLKGEASVYSLELPPYRPPQIMTTIRTSVTDRTIKVLWRAVTMAAPAGAVIWLVSNIMIGDQSIAAYLVTALNPLGVLLGLNGIILLAYIVAIPANEIVIPTILMLTMTLGVAATGTGAQAGVLAQMSDTQVHTVLTTMGGWTILTAINLMLFSLLHYPCSTTLLTIYHETRNLKWTVVAALLPLGLAMLVTFGTATVFRLFGWA
ncbi:MAG TPA: nucleoside recognition domain-containing protein [Candidatus Limnocylindrales bacterium]|nr:nucleoside recognition domain-containing protein [Candidatus Limnocylindrales bacterium]